MTELLPNYVAGHWQTGTGTGTGTALRDPVLGTELVRVDASGLDLPAAFAFARERGGAALRALTYVQRAELLAKVVQVLQTHREAYYEIATANSGTVRNDSAVDIDGAIFTLGQYAKMGQGLGERHFLLDGEAGERVPQHVRASAGDDPGGAGAHDAAGHRRQQGREGDACLDTRERRDALLDLRSVLMDTAHLVRRHGAHDLRRQQ